MFLWFSFGIDYCIKITLKLFIIFLDTFLFQGKHFSNILSNFALVHCHKRMNKQYFFESIQFRKKVYICILSDIFIANEAQINKSFVNFIADKRFHNMFKELSVLEKQESIELVTSFFVIDLLLFIKIVSIPTQKMGAPLIQIHSFGICELIDIGEGYSTP